ncbi:hypothetical protein F441_04145 [Phytophthora nicotianae CJ01A1]|uniref:Uncharacterized protein n=4 Tax=Phytophthora nicotianae TaxID=4792 RepID=W2ZT61_PHYNI|nr:hypothetical protein L915_04054 [Phytophthora nicotianae]ETL46021.1 hypothetical protein L916_04005 [Phytophthora nicotianae]ETO81410.1 hypothetical protein F444_04245 [Phytophthora nicotianae P1976]ETP22571.1 hypothetical protein F441_04145 [Phytophthora nicotianae CJ01A1]ETP50537.1 hypothetical protein F442_04163 [Phytophthora nicotianae P10297]
MSTFVQAPGFMYELPRRLVGVHKLRDENTVSDQMRSVTLEICVPISFLASVDTPLTTPSLTTPLFDRYAAVSRLEQGSREKVIATYKHFLWRSDSTHVLVHKVLFKFQPVWRSSLKALSDQINQES